MNRNIGGPLDMSALGRLHFHSLDANEQANAIRRMAATGLGAHTIAHATGLSVEFIRQLLRDQAAAPGGST
jgi:hypothetical protein